MKQGTLRFAKACSRGTLLTSCLIERVSNAFGGPKNEEKGNASPTGGVSASMIITSAGLPASDLGVWNLVQINVNEQRMFCHVGFRNTRHECPTASEEG